MYGTKDVDNVSQIGVVAETLGISVHTIRFYERKGLIVPLRNESGYRVYPPEVVDSIRFIKVSREMGFSLDEIKLLLFYRDDTHKHCDAIKSMVSQKIEHIESSISKLKQQRTRMMDVIKSCIKESGNDCKNCSLITGLEDCT